MEQYFTVILLLVACLIALLLVAFARRESSIERESAHRDATQWREEARERIAEAQRKEQRLHTRETELNEDQRHAAQYTRVLEERSAEVVKQQRVLQEQESSLRENYAEQLAHVAGLTADEARAELRQQLIAAAKAEVAAELRALEKRAELDAEERAQMILAHAMQRVVGAAASQGSVTWIDLPSDEMKGRIIGREGRNIRTFENLTGVNLIVDEGVNAVQLSSFDVERREVATATLTSLIEDGRIQPQRIEAAYARAVAGAAKRHMDAGLDAVQHVQIKGIDPALIEILGRSRLRSSYGQNVLDHLGETALLAQSIAEEMGADPVVAKRAAFLHDVGKVLQGEYAGTHAAIGAMVCKKYGEDEIVVNAVAAHHDEIPHTSVESVIVQIADAISASRPGARRDDAESYFERLDNLEKLVGEHPGVTKVAAMSAGREVRVIVEPDEVDDARTQELAENIARRIEEDYNFLGEIKVTVIRERRAEAVAG